MTDLLLHIIIIAVLSAAGIVFLYFLLFAGPALVIFRISFSRQKGKTPATITEKHPYLGKYAKETADCAEYIKSFPSERVSVFASDGTKLSGTYYGKGSKALALCFHGYRGGPLMNFAVLGKDLLDMGFDIILVDQRAHFSSGGTHSTLGIIESDDVCCWVDWVDRNISCDRILLCGVSMGSGAIAMASDRIHSPKVSAMILESCIRSPYEQMKLEMIRRLFPPSIVLPLVRRQARKVLGIELRQSVCDSLAKTDIPAFFLHGSKDKVSPLRIGNACYEACHSTKEMIIAEGAGHTAAYITAHDDAKPLVCSFITRYFGSI